MWVLYYAVQSAVVQSPDGEINDPLLTLPPTDRGGRENIHYGLEEKLYDRWDNIIAPLSQRRCNSRALMACRTHNTRVIYAPLSRWDGRMAFLDEGGALHDYDCDGNIRLWTYMYPLFSGGYRYGSWRGGVGEGL